MPQAAHVPSASASPPLCLFPGLFTFLSAAASACLPLLPPPPPSAAAAPASSSRGGSAEERFLDRWLTVATTRFAEELVGVRTMAMLGRFRRRIAVLGMAALVRGRGWGRGRGRG